MKTKTLKIMIPIAYGKDYIQKRIELQEMVDQFYRLWLPWYEPVYKTEKNW